MAHLWMLKSADWNNRLYRCFWKSEKKSCVKENMKSKKEKKSLGLNPPNRIKIKAAAHVHVQ